MKTKSLLISTLFAAASMVAANATDYVWTGTTNGTWDNKSFNWQVVDSSGTASSLVVFPAGADSNAIFTTNESQQEITLAMDGAIGNVSILGYYKFEDGGYNLEGKTFTIGSFTETANANLSLWAQLNFTNIEVVSGATIQYGGNSTTWESVLAEGGKIQSEGGTLTINNLTVVPTVAIDGTDYDVTGSSLEGSTIIIKKLSGKADLNITGTSTVVINDVADYTGQVKTSGAANVTFNVAQDQSVTYCNTNTTVNLSLKKTGAGTLVLTGYKDALFTDITLSGGTVQLDLSGNNYGTSDQGADAHTGSRGLASGGAMNVAADTTLDISTANFSLIGAGYGRISLNFSNNATLTINSTNSSKRFYITNTNLTGTGTIKLTGRAYVEVSGSSAAFGTVTNGALDHAVGLSMESGTQFTTGSANYTALAFLEGTGGDFWTNAKPLYIYSTKDAEFAGVIHSSAAITLTKGGNYKWTLSGVNAYAGTTSILAGTLELATANAIKTDVTMTGGTLELSVAGAGNSLGVLDISNADIVVDANQTLASSSITLARSSAILVGDDTAGTPVLTLSGTTSISATSGTNEIDVDLAIARENMSISVSDGAVLTVSGSMSSSGSSIGTIVKSGAGTLELTADNSSMTHAFTISDGSVELEDANALAGVKSLTLAKSTSLSADSEVRNVVIGGDVSNEGVMTLKNGVTFNGKVTNYGTITLGGYVKFTGDVTGEAGFDNLATITLSNGTYADSLHIDGGTLAIDANVTLNNVSLNNIVLSILVDEADDPNDLAGTAVKMTGTFACTSLQGVNLSKVVFSKNSLTKVIFDFTEADNGEQVATDFLLVLNGRSTSGKVELLDDISGTWSRDGALILFTSSSTNTIIWSEGYRDGASLLTGEWNPSEFNSQATQPSSIIAFNPVTNSDGNAVDVAVGMTGSIKVGDLLVYSGDTHYTLTAQTSASVTADTLRMTTGTLSLVRTSFVLTGGVEILGGTLELLTSNTLKTDEVTMTGGTLVLGDENALTNATTINMSGGTRLEFVHGAASSALINITNSTKEGSAVVLALQAGLGETPQGLGFGQGKLDYEKDAWINFEVGEGSTLEFASYANTSSAEKLKEDPDFGANFVKSGAGTLIMNTAGTLSGTLKITEGVVGFGSAGDNGQAVFQGDITVGDGTNAATLQLFDSNSLSVYEQVETTISVYAGAQVLISPLTEGASSPYQNISKITFDLYGGALNGLSDTGNAWIYANNLKDGAGLVINAKDGYKTSSVGAFLIRADATDALTFNVGDDAVLTVSATFIQSVEKAGFVKNGAGTLILASELNKAENLDSSYLSGTLLVNAGTLQIGNGDGAMLSEGTLGDEATISLAAGTLLKVDLGVDASGKDSTLEFNGKLQGEGDLVVSSGTFEITEQDALLAETTDDDGNTTTAAAFSGSITVEAGATLLLAPNSLSLTNDVTLAGTLGTTGTGVNTTQNITLAGTLNLVGDNATISSDSIARFVFAKDLELAEDSATKLTISGSNTYLRLQENDLGGNFTFVITDGGTLSGQAGTNSALNASAISIDGAGTLSGGWVVNTLTVSGTGTKTISGTVRISNDTLNISQGATLTLGSSARLISNSIDGKLTIAGSGQIELGTSAQIQATNLELSQKMLSSSSYSIINSGVISADVATINGGRFSNDGAMRFGTATFTADTTIENGTWGSLTGIYDEDARGYVGTFNINSGVSLTISKGNLGSSRTSQTTLTGGGEVKLTNSASIMGSLIINNVTLSSTAKYVGLSTLASSLVVDAGTLASAIEVTNDDATLYTTNSALIGGNINTTRQSMDNDSATIELENTKVAGNLTLNSTDAKLSGTEISGVITLRLGLDQESINKIVNDEIGEVTDQEQYFSSLHSGLAAADSITITNDVMFGGIEAKEMRLLYYPYERFTFTGVTGYNEETGDPITGSKTIRISDQSTTLNLVIENEDAIGAEYSLYSGKVVLWDPDNNRSYTWTAADSAAQTELFNRVYSDYVLYNSVYSYTSLTYDFDLGEWVPIERTSPSVAVYINFEANSEDLYLDITSDGITVKRAGALVWNNLTGTWSDSVWEVTQKGGDNATGQAYVDDKYVTVKFTAGKILTLDMDAEVKGLNFVGNTSTTTLTFDQAGHGITGLREWTENLYDDDGNLLYEYVGDNENFEGTQLTLADLTEDFLTDNDLSIDDFVVATKTVTLNPVFYVESGIVQINNLGKNDFDNAIIATGTKLTINSVSGTDYAISGTNIQLAGTLAFNTNYTSAETLTIVGNASEISVVADKAVELGNATGTTGTLTKTGAGTLTLAGDSDVGTVNVSAGTLIFAETLPTTMEVENPDDPTGDPIVVEVPAAALGVTNLNVLAGASAIVNSSVVSTALSLGENATLTLNNESNTLTTLTIADGAKLSAESAIALADGASISATGTSTIAGTLNQGTAGVAIATDLNAVLTVDAWTTDAESVTDEGETIAGAILRKTGSGKLAITNAELAGTTFIAAGTLAYGNEGTITTGNVIVTGASTLAFDAEGDVTFGDEGTASTISSYQDVTVTLTKTSSGTLTLNTNLALLGTLDANVKSGLILAASENVYDTINFNKLTFADGSGALSAGTLAAAGTNPVLTIAGTTTGNLGNISLGAALTLSLADGAVAQFGALSGSRNMTVTGAGTAKLTGIANNSSLTIANGATLEIAAGTIGKSVTASEDTKLVKTGDADSVLSVTVANDNFVGDLTVKAGTLYLNGGSFANADMTVEEAGTILVALNDKASVGGENAIAATLVGAGTLALSGENTFSFAEGSTEDFTGTILATNAATVDVDNLTSAATISLDGAIAKASGESTISNLKVSYAGTNVIWNENQKTEDEDGNEIVSLGTLEITNFSYSTTTTGSAGTLQTVTELGDIVISGDITNGLNINALTTEEILTSADDSAGTLKLTGTNELGNVSVQAGAAIEVTENTTIAGKVTLNGGSLKFTNSGDQQVIDTEITSTNAIVSVQDDAENSNNYYSEVITAGDIELTNIAGYTGKIVSESGTLTIECTDIQLASKWQYFEAQENAAIDLIISNDDALQGKAEFAGAGTINLKGDGNLTIVSANNDFAGTLNVSKNLTLSEEATLGTAAVKLATNATLTLDSSNKGLVIDAGKSVQGDTTTKLIKNGIASAYAGDVDVGTIEINAGTLALKTIRRSTTLVTLATNAVLETGMTLENGKLVGVTDSKSAHTVQAKYQLVGDSVTFSHNSTVGKSIIMGSWAEATNENKIIELAYGGEGSVFSLAQGAATFRKTGEGTWIISQALGTGDLLVSAGTLVVQNYTADHGNFTLSEASTLEIEGFASGTPTVIEGAISGSGTLQISNGGTEEDPVTIGEINSSGTWILSVATIVEMTEDFSNTIVVEDNGKLRFNAEDDFDFDGTIVASGASSAVIQKVGAGTLTLGSNFDLTGNFEIDEGAVVVTNSLGISQEGTVTLAAGTTIAFDPGAGNSATLNKEIYGSGTIDFRSGTTTITLNSSEFAGTINIDSAATIVYALPDLPTAGTGLGANITGDGVIRIDANEATIATRWVSTSFAGTVEVKKGTLEITPEMLNDMSADIVYVAKTASNAIVKLTDADDTVLSTLASKFSAGTNQKGELDIDGSAILESAGFVDNVNIRVINGSYITAMNGYANADLIVDLGGELVISAATSSRRFASTGTSTTAGTLLTVNGNLVVDGDLTITTGGSSMISVGGNATLSSTANITLSEIPTDSIIISAAGTITDKTVYGAYQLSDGTVLSSALRNEGTTLVVDRYIETPASSGLENFADTLDTVQGSDIWREVNNASTAKERNAILRNFSPVSFGALTDLSLGIAGTQNDLLRQRLEQRRYDRAFPENFFKQTHMFYANAFGHSGETTAGTNKNPNYDIDYYGAQVGVDTNLSAHALAGINVTYATGKADIHNHGGKHEIDSLRLGVYSQIMFDEQTYLGLGAHMGFDSFDTKRQTAFNTNESDTNGYNLGLSATLGRLFVVSSDWGLHFSPYVGLDFDYVSIAKFSEEKAAGTSFDIDSFDRQSLRGTVGASFTWAPTIQWRLSIDVGYHHEFLDDHSTIDAKFNSGVYNGGSAKVKAYFANEDTLSVGPRIEYRLNSAWAINAGYTYETDFDETDSHSANVGFRGRF